MSNLALNQQKELSVATVKKYLVSGNGNVTEQECMMFIALCKFQKLNPFLREAYLIKFGSAPASIVVGKEVFTKRASKINDCAGWEAGIIVKDTTGKIIKKYGICILPQEMLLGGWARVHRHNWKVPFEHEVSLNEYARKKSDGTLQSTWASMPATMIRKVALVQALRDTFPEDFQGLYDSAEMPTEDIQLQETPIRANEVNEVIENGIKENFKDENFEKLETTILNEKPLTISESQRKRLFAIAGGKTDKVSEVCEQFGYKSSKDILTKDYEKICMLVHCEGEE